MSPTVPTPTRSAAEVSRHLSLPSSAKELLRGDMPAHAYLAALLQHGDHESAIRVMPHVLAKPEAVWWGSLCLWEASRPSPEPPVDDVLGAVLRWLRDPSEANRQPFAEMAEAAGGPATPAGTLALASLYSGGTMGPPQFSCVPPPDHLTAILVSGSVLLAASRLKTISRDDALRHFLRWGTDVADGKNRWS